MILFNLHAITYTLYQPMLFPVGCTWGCVTWALNSRDYQHSSWRHIHNRPWAQHERSCSSGWLIYLGNLRCKIDHCFPNRQKEEISWIRADKIPKCSLRYVMFFLIVVYIKGMNSCSQQTVNIDVNFMLRTACLLSLSQEWYYVFISWIYLGNSYLSRRLINYV